MNWKRIVIYSLSITIIGVAYGFFMAYLGLDMPVSYGSNEVWFFVYFIVPLPIYSAVYFSLSKGLDSHQYKSSIVVALLSSLYGYSAIYFLLGELMLSIIDVIDAGVGAAAIFIGTSLGIKVRARNENA
ncbi:MAG: hypothetical protein L0G80_18930 [Shewanella sp.]|uniref:hypothetical protein n=1 Tax=Shewanella sp. TaxID=50422 RepID=UPI0026495AB2|nr:hypothetical protein [Shewanella sp.]MDN5501980.1 hypothetical protein [Shewanella sp.]MDN5529980.1 hypothetical protein [Shewanella sp.]